MDNLIFSLRKFQKLRTRSASGYFIALTGMLLFLHGVVSDRCPNHLSEVKQGYTKIHNNTCYLFVNNEEYWKDARGRCWDLGGEMLAVENINTMTFIRHELTTNKMKWRSNGVWIGARYNKKWRWTNGKELTFTNWAEGEPSKLWGLFSVEDCALMRREDQWRWHDNLCSKLKFHYNYICQFPLSKPTDTQGKLYGSAKHTTTDNGNGAKIIWIIVCCAILLLVIAAVGIAARILYLKSKKKSNNIIARYSNTPTVSSPSSTQVIEPSHRPAAPLPLPPGPPICYIQESPVHQATCATQDTYSEVNKPSKVRERETRTQGASPDIALSSPSGSRTECDGADIQTPLIEIPVTRFSHGMGSKNKSNSSEGDYIDMSSGSRSSTDSPLTLQVEADKTSDKHTYSNIQTDQTEKEEKHENLYEALP